MKCQREFGARTPNKFQMATCCSNCEWLDYNNAKYREDSYPKSSSAFSCILRVNEPKFYLQPLFACQFEDGRKCSSSTWYPSFPTTSSKSDLGTDCPCRRLWTQVVQNEPTRSERTTWLLLDLRWSSCKGSTPSSC